MRVAITNIGSIVSGDWRSPFAAGDTLILDDGLISHVGTASPEIMNDCDVTVDAAGTVAIPGLIDSHVHITFGDYTPRQKTVGFLESYVHGGTTTSITASEVHVPGRPKDRDGVKALAVAAHKSFKEYRPGGMRVHAGSIILEPGLVESDFADIAAKGVWLAKAGFGAFDTPYGYVDQVRWAKEAGMITTVHTGGSSIPGSSGIWADHVIAMNADVSFHVNGGPVAMPDADFVRLVNESRIALQCCTAGNLRTLLMVADLAVKADCFDRLLVATDTPTGSGIMPLGMFYTITHLASLGKMPVEWAIAAATGNNAAVYRLNSGIIAPGRDADVLLIDACAGGAKNDALSAIANGDVPAVSAVFTDGVPRFVGRSRNTPAGMRSVRVTESRIMQDFSAAAH
ncbi:MULTISPECIES: amidohydrolase family protein [unclassified Chelatococcus]|uniref:amidohydrolase family protein n=1 Tax=unclassified Chelatococcus TaxID=2638111 RepID=UPI001BCBD0CA|nr:MULTISPECIES: amidohydrolase family protein [unclassified Chelatococcus]CAH1653297.1 Enamidase [Hyphomicrobiales bacterium]MBS7742920.1 amidohydrolase family protein [Chelatococcus sp. HY11]MBX3541962.1 amidohydrolase family protein [Chelatococcus sp.]MCO5074146.1 amidohydrolase family protein [Chelatococcus sp.]CAH1694342.1 Enamidase [Hyphomicrobiales bacterium]